MPVPSAWEEGGRAVRSEERAPRPAVGRGDARAAVGAQRLRLAANVLRNFSTLGATTKAQ